MSKTYCTIMFFAVALTVIGFAAVAQAEILFADNFNGTTAPPGATDYNLNANLSGPTGRLSGTLAGSLGTTAWVRDSYGSPAASYVQVNNTSAGADALNLSYKVDSPTVNTGANINHNFVDQNILNAHGFTIRFDVDPMSAGSPTGTGTTHNRGAWVGVGGPTADRTGLYAPKNPETGDLTFGLKDGQYFVWQKGYTIATVGDTLFETASTTIPDYVWYTAELRITTDSFAQGAAYAADAYVCRKGGTLFQLDMNGTGVGKDGMTLYGTWDADGTNYIGFGANVNSTIDNVSITIVPEPSALALLGMGLVGLLAYAWRKRK